jgi:E3 ubiquitin-protein ligase UBR1
MAKIIASIGLAVTIRSARDVFREQVCFLLCDWMNHIVSGHYKFFQDVQDGDTIIRDIICEELCKEWALKPALAALSTRYRRKSIPEEEEEEEEEEENDDIDEDDDDDDMPHAEPAMMEAIVVDDLDEDDVTMYQFLGAEPSDVLDTFPSFMQRQQFETSDDSEQETDHTFEDLEERREVERKRWHERRKHGDIADLSWDLPGLIQEFKDLDNQELNFSEKIGASAMAKQKQRGDQPLGSKMLTEFKQKLRLDYFMLLDLRLWKDMRMCLRKMFISTLVANLSYKRILGK